METSSTDDSTTVRVWDCRKCSAFLPRTPGELEKACPACGRQMSKAKLYKSDVTPRTFYQGER